MHYHYIEDERGELFDVVPFCCDSCHRAWCKKEGVEYDGWCGANEGGDSVEFCANCGTVAGGAYECDCQRDNVVVNRFLNTKGIKCKHRHWIQLPEKIVGL